jgi:hypothetical protein
MSACSTIDFGNPYRFNTSSSNASNAISILNSANDACRMHGLIGNGVVVILKLIF